MVKRLLARKMTTRRGFTLIELLVVLAILAALLSLTSPRYFGAVDMAKETALRTNLRAMREAIEKFEADNQRLPVALEELASQKYLRGIPQDPLTERIDTWVLVPAPDGIKTGVHDVRSGAQGLAKDGSAYASW
jgi:general secretion pathway protein G